MRKSSSAPDCVSSAVPLAIRPCGCRSLRPGAGDLPPGEPTLGKCRNCYVCKQPFPLTHRYYDSMCRECGDFNYAKREQTADLSGRFVLVTGARVKIGYQAALQLLR